MTINMQNMAKKVAAAHLGRSKQAKMNVMREAEQIVMKGESAIRTALRKHSEDVKREMEKLGFKVEKVSLFHGHQGGDGVRLEGSIVFDFGPDQEMMDAQQLNDMLYDHMGLYGVRPNRRGKGFMVDLSNA